MKIPSFRIPLWAYPLGIALAAVLAWYFQIPDPSPEQNPLTLLVRILYALLGFALVMLGSCLYWQRKNQSDESA